MTTHRSIFLSALLSVPFSLWARPGHAEEMRLSPEPGDGEPARTIEPTEQEPTPLESLIELETGVDLATRYFARGLSQPVPGLILEPFIAPSILAYEGDDGITLATVHAGMWTALSGGAGDAREFFEADFYAGAEVEIASSVALGLNYQAAFSPILAFEPAHELQLSVAGNDSSLWGELTGDRFLGVAPSVSAAVELIGTAMGKNRGVFLAPKLEPSVVLYRRGAVEVVAHFPIELGLSGGEFYETDAGESHFGYLDSSASVDIALPEIAEGTSDW